MKLDIIHNQDCLKGMRNLPSDSIDLIATDPPYGIAFMGRAWDRAIPSVDIWREALRVLKPGAFAFVMCIPRQDCLARMVVSLEETGFVVSFTSLYWAYASGFPKAQNIGKAVDKKLGAERKVIGRRIRGDVEKAKQSGTTFAVADANKNNKDIFGYGIEDITLPATPQAQLLDGSYAGFQPKPAVEIILVAMKPLSEKTYVDQALKNGKGVTWLNNGRIPYEGKAPSGSGKHISWRKQEGRVDKTNDSDWYKTESSSQGRFPANLLVSDDALNIGDSGSFSRYFSLDVWFTKKLKELPAGMQKSFPFLIVPKASKAEKNRGCEGLPLHESRYGKNFSSSDKGTISSSKRPSCNNHPTCKPIKLMSYLITLGSCESDIVLDPFIGSGTTAIAARMLRRHYIAYEIDKEYCKIAKARLSVIEKRMI